MCGKDSFAEAEMDLLQRSRLRCLLPKDYRENKREMRPTLRPHSANGNLRRKINIKIERIFNLQKALNIQNKQRDKIEIQEINEEDIAELQVLLDDDDTDTVSIDDDETPTPNALVPLEVDKELSLEYSYTTDVSIFILLS